MHEKMAYWFLIAVTIISVIVAAVLFFVYKDFEYTKHIAPVDAVKMQKIDITGDGTPRSIKFKAVFKYNAGALDFARLKREKGILKVAFYDIDGNAEKHLVGYVVEGTISGLKPNEYELQIYDNSSNKVILSKKVIIL